MGIGLLSETLGDAVGSVRGVELKVASEMRSRDSSCVEVPIHSIYRALVVIPLAIIFPFQR